MDQWFTIMIAAIIAFIGGLNWRTAWLQWQTTHNRAVFDQLFERRYKIYTPLREVVAEVDRTGEADKMLFQILFLKLAPAREEAQFLFGDDVVAYLNKFAEDLSHLDCLWERGGDETELESNI